MKEIQTNAFFNDENGNLCMMFGYHYIGIIGGVASDPDGKEPDLLYLQLSELQKPFYEGMDKKDFKPRTDMGSVILYFNDVEGVDTVIGCLQKIRKHLVSANNPE